MKKIYSLMIPLSLGIYLSSSTSLNAAVQWLPDALEEGLKFDGHSFPKGVYHNGITDLDCKSYELSSCPSHGLCERCIYNSGKYKITGCKSPYVLSGNQCVCPAAISLGEHDECTQKCGNNCIAAKCVAPEYTKRCTHGTTRCADGCGSDSLHKRTRTCCAPCPVFTGSLPPGAVYTYISCIDETHPLGNSVPSGWVCGEGYDDRIVGNERKCVRCGDNFNLTSCPPNAICQTCGGKVAFISCQDGYINVNGRCQINGQVSSGSGLGDSFPNLGTSDCVDVISTKPEHSHFITAVCRTNLLKTYITGWECDDGYTKSGNSCVEDCPGYTLDKCPEEGECSKCTSGSTVKYKLNRCFVPYDMIEDKCSLECDGENALLTYLCYDNGSTGLCNGKKIQVGDKYYAAVANKTSSTRSYNQVEDDCYNAGWGNNSFAGEYSLPSEELMKKLFNDSVAYNASGLPKNAGPIFVEGNKYCEKGKGCHSSSGITSAVSFCVKEVCPNAEEAICPTGYFLRCPSVAAVGTKDMGNYTCYKCGSAPSSSISDNNGQPVTRKWTLSANLSGRGNCTNRTNYNVKVKFTSLDGTTIISEAHLPIVMDFVYEGEDAKRSVPFNKPIPDNQAMRLYIEEYWSRPEGHCNVGGLPGLPRVMVNGERLGGVAGQTKEYEVITPKPWRDAEVQFTLVFDGN